MRNLSESATLSPCTTEGRASCRTTSPIPETRIYIVGWVRLPPGNRDHFMALAPACVKATSAEPGCHFFKMNPSASDPDEVTTVECFVDQAAHTAHVSTGHSQAFLAELGALALSVRFERVLAGRVETGEIALRPS